MPTLFDSQKPLCNRQWFDTKICRRTSKKETWKPTSKRQLTETRRYLCLWHRKSFAVQQFVRFSIFIFCINFFWFQLAVQVKRNYGTVFQVCSWFFNWKIQFSIVLKVYFCRNFYVDFILDWRTKIIMLFVFCAYLALSTWGIMTMEQGLDYEKLLLKTDPLVSFRKNKFVKFVLGKNGKSRNWAIPRRRSGPF